MLKEDIHGTTYYEADYSDKYDGEAVQAILVIAVSVLGLVGAFTFLGGFIR